MPFSPPPPPGPVKSALRTLDIIGFVVAHPQGPAAQDIAAALGIPDSSLSYLLATLVEHGYLTRDGRRYRPGAALAALQPAAAAPSLAARAAPLVRVLRAELDETASFMVRTGWEAEALVTEASGQALRYAIEPGQRKPLHTLAAGKVLLAALSEDELARYFAQAPRARLTDASVTDEAALRSQIAAARSEDFAAVSEEDTRGICGLAVPARLGAEVVGAFAVAVPLVRCDPDLPRRAREIGRAHV